MLTGLLTLGEFSLEVLGAIASFRRRLWSLFLMLSAAVLADLVKFFLRGNAYGIAWWAAQAVQYLFLAWIAAQIASKLLHEHPKRRHGLVIVCMVAGVICSAFEQGETWLWRFLDAEIAASCALGLMLLLVWWGRAWRIEQPWGWIAAGLLAYVAGNALCAWLLPKWHGAASLFQLVDIAALGLWAWAGWRDWRCEGARLSLGKKTPASHKLYEWEQKRVI